MQTMKIFDSITDDGNLNILVKLLEFHGTGNDNYHGWEVDAQEGDAGGGYMTAEEETEVHNWLKALGAEAGENVLIYVWW